MLLTEIETFLAIAATGSFRKAGEMLNVTQSTVSLRLKRLESELGYLMIDRRRGDKQVRLTPAGDGFLRAAEQIKTALQSVTTGREADSKLRIGAVDSVNVYLLAGLFESVRQNEPSIHLEVGTHQSWQVYELIERNELDLGFVLTARPSVQVTATPLFYENLSVMRIRRDDWPEAVSAGELDPKGELPILWGDRVALWHDQIWDPTVSPLCRPDTVALVRRLMVSPDQWCLVPQSVRAALEGEFSFQQLAERPPQRICYRLEPRHPRPSAGKALAVVRELSDQLAQSYQADGSIS
ncbi:LysR family transcriptional regulator [Jonquetella anthropi]|uniref:LysR family transcriptional regulator n=1 Tax=Jonquetella anthropi TaxID=428712 RepID=UPI0001B91040|nr:LysR family transcriptional regulator [Jonquetella anthropi]EEX49084.1 transcriptional regulator, LysR family [Jonquetella anthropi E3_33 E1]